MSDEYHKNPLLYDYRVCEQELEEMTKQRDDLLAAAKEMLERLEQIKRPSQIVKYHKRNLRAAITKAEGGEHGLHSR